MSTFSVESLSVPLVQAPMAGGPSTPALAAAVSDAGGLGSLAAGYLSAEALSRDIEEFRALSSGPLLVNIFVPEAQTPSPADVEAYRTGLRSWTLDEDIRGEVPPVSDSGDDMYREKLAVVMDHRPDVVTFTFGLPDVLTIERLHEVGVLVGATVTTVREGREVTRMVRTSSSPKGSVPAAIAASSTSRRTPNPSQPQASWEVCQMPPPFRSSAQVGSTGHRLLSSSLTPVLLRCRSALCS